MQLRNDFKFALVEEYRTYWNAYDNEKEFYSDILSMDPSMYEHFGQRRMAAKGQSGLCELRLLDQNTLWFVIYGRTKRALECLKVVNEQDVQFIGTKHRLMVNRKIIDCQNQNLDT